MVRAPQPIEERVGGMASGAALSQRVGTVIAGAQLFRGKPFREVPIRGVCFDFDHGDPVRARAKVIEQVPYGAPKLGVCPGWVARPQFPRVTPLMVSAQSQ